MGPLLAAAIPAAIGGALGFAGGERGNAANARMAQQQMDFQERMANTTYQRATEDMRKAGLNPALAYHQGGAPAPQGASADMKNTLSGAANDARSSAQSFTDARTAKEQQALLRAQASKTEAEAEMSRAEALARINNLTSTSNATNESTADVVATREQRYKQSRYQTSRMYWDARYLNDFYTDRREQLKREIQQSIANARETNARAQLHELDVPQARNRANAQSSWWMKKVSPYINDAKSVSGALPTVVVPLARRGKPNPRGIPSIQRRQRFD